ncbi:MAG: M48 family peptidase, partial [Synechococcaceae cyanobacterium]
VDRVLEEREVHGPRFRARMATINAAQDAFVVSVRHRYPVPAGAAPGCRWIARCPRCGATAPYRRRVSNLACRACCERHHGGLWDASCLLEFVEAAA